MENEDGVDVSRRWGNPETFSVNTYLGRNYNPTLPQRVRRSPSSLTLNPTVALIPIPP